jgi:RNA polymerase sigma-70 factor, ECF subfamily
MAMSAPFDTAAAVQLEVFGECLEDAIKACRVGRVRPVVVKPVAVKPVAAKSVAVKPVAAAHKTVPSDEVLIDQIAKGNQAAIRTLMSRHQARVSRFILRFVGDRNLVEDLVCDTFFAAWQQAPHFERRSSVATWLLAIARYKALSARERRSLPTEPLDEIAAATLVDATPRPDAMIEREDTARFLRQCLAALPPEQAVLIDLVYYRDKSVKEAALLTGVPENTVKSRMFLARKKLAAMLDAADADSKSVTLVPNDTPVQADAQREGACKVASEQIDTAKDFALT